MELTKLREDEFVFQIVKDPLNPPDTMLVMAYIGRAAADSCVRLYLDPLLSAYLDVPEDSILYYEALPRSQSPFGGHYVWVKREPDLMRDLQEAVQKAAQTLQEVISQGQGASIANGFSSGSSGPQGFGQGFNQQFGSGFGQGFGSGFGQS
jgi:hypothetical protein